ncbi:MAG: ABC transporter ATP-binding protein [Desulfobacteraceae bacterium]|jgi:ATP-binding cassette subfamily B protein
MRSDLGNFEEERLGKAYDLALIRRIFPFMKPYTLVFAVSVTMLAMITVLDLAIPYVTREAIDNYIVPVLSRDATGSESRMIRVDVSDNEGQRVVARNGSLFEKKENDTLLALTNLEAMDEKDIRIVRKKDFRGVTVVALLILGIVAIQFILTFIQKLVTEYAGQMIMHDIRMRVFTHIQSLSLTFFNKNPVGRLVTRATNDIQNMQEMFSSVIDFVFKDLFLILGIAGVLLAISPKLALVSFAVIPFVLMASIYFSRFARGAFRNLRVLTARINTRISETIQGMRVIQLFRYESENHNTFASVNHDNYMAGIKQLQIFSVFMPVVELLGSVALALIIFYGGKGVIVEAVSLGTLVAFISYIKMFFRPIRDVAEKYNVLQNAMSSAERIFQVLDKTEDIEEEDGGQHVMKRRELLGIRHVEFKDVNFGYTETEQVLQNLSFTLSQGEVLAVVGPTGAGKTSLINLLVGFYKPTSGNVSFNFVDRSSYDLKSIRSRIALVTQDPFLFSGTVRQNILGETNSMSESQFRDILKAAHCDALVDKLPQGVDTALFEGGSGLSSGERQLISIARAIARDPDLIILDEATSYIDSESEVQIQDALENLMRSRTSVVIAHRISTARNADRILVLKKGRVVECGNHRELMELGGLYFKMVKMKG